MMEESKTLFDDIYAEIMEGVDFSAFDKFEALIKKNITRAVIKGEDNPGLVSVSFKCQQLLEGLTPFANSKGKEQAYEVGAQTLLTITNALQFELDEEEAFLLFHLRGLGKFRKREAELLKELKKLWESFPDYAMEDRDFSRALKNLMRDKFIQYRKGNIHLNPSFVIRYRV